jgi:hypothetical protein
MNLQIERAHITGLDWALENVKSSNRKTNWVYEAEEKKTGVDVSILFCRRLLSHVHLGRTLRPRSLPPR